MLRWYVRKISRIGGFSPASVVGNEHTEVWAIGGGWDMCGSAHTRISWPVEEGGSEKKNFFLKYVFKIIVVLKNN